jgi:hypothetical protein
MSAWYRSTTSGSSDVVHNHGCPYLRHAGPWRAVDGYKTRTVIDHIGGVPWLRICTYCADRLDLPAEHPARRSTHPTRVTARID